MTKKDVIQQWLLIEVKIHNGLKKLSKIDAERDFLVAQKSNDEAKMKIVMDEYTKLAKEMESYKNESKLLKIELEEILTAKELEELMKNKNGNQ